jgi:hypothetical protein
MIEDSYEQGFTDGGRYVLNMLVNEHQYDIPGHLEIWQDFFDAKPPPMLPIARPIKKERLRILGELDMIEKQSHDTRTPLYQETLIQLMRDRINNG